MALPPSSPLLVFAGLQAQIPGAEESKREGSTLFVQCRYTTQAGFPSQKTWCRLSNGFCEALVETTYLKYKYINQVTAGRVTIEDDIKHGTISITIRNLQVQDSGLYACASSHNTDTYIPLKKISLNVFKGEYVPLHTNSSLVKKEHHSLPRAIPPLPPHSSVNIFILLSVVLGILLILALISMITLYIKKCRQPRRGMWRLEMPPMF
uniref:Ig-like domain-containing protein n=1 Tax=Apteryx owenii TaxID=8824 RepID=A0A8B9QME7_APTOW